MSKYANFKNNSDFIRSKSSATKVVHAGSKLPESATRPKVPPIYATSVFAFDCLDDIDRVYEGNLPGYIYSRMGNPGLEIVQDVVATLENTPDAVLFSSGMAAITVSILSQVSCGDHIVAANVLYGGSYSFLRNELRRRGVETTFVNIDNLSSVKNALRPNTKIVYCETISNPLMGVADLEELSNIAHSNRSFLFVDNTFASPVLCRPFEHGADVVIHSGTKYLNGHSDVTCGVMCCTKEIAEAIRPLAVIYGPVPSPFDAWLLLRGLRTLFLRMERHSKNALKLATFLESHPKVKVVHYPGLKSSPYHELARKYLDGGFGGMLSFEVEGGLDGARAVVDSLRMVELVPSLAGVATTVSHPGKTSHRAIPPQERESYGVGDGLIRVSVGIEEYSDIEEDFRQALDNLGT